MRTFFVVVLLALTPLALLAQTVTVQRTSNLRNDPSTSNPPITKLHKGDQAALLDAATTAGYYHVKTAAGQEGWLWAKNVSVSVAQPTTNLNLLGPIPIGSCSAIANLAACPDSGCEQNRTTHELEQVSETHALLNHEKKIILPAGTPTLLTFDDFKTLQQDATSNVGEDRELTAADRAKLHSDVTNGTVAEGNLVRVAGFVSNVRVNTGESVNCYFPRQVNNDFHINLTPQSAQEECNGIVVEMIPQHRSWSKAKLDALKQKNKMVRATGQLLYDNLHRVNTCSNPVPKQPHRFALWEVHPIIEFEVCKHDGACDPVQDNEWGPLQ
jgi:uncharacterized protein YgiM (DUF1202 family)